MHRHLHPAGRNQHARGTQEHAQIEAELVQGHGEEQEEDTVVGEAAEQHHLLRLPHRFLKTHRLRIE